MDNGVRWSELPPEIWSAVGKHLHNYIDAVRFRSVCRSWRSSVPPVPKISPPIRLRFPSPINTASLFVDAFLSQSTFYRLAPLIHEQSPNSSSSSQNGRLVKMEKSELGKMRFLHPLSKRLIRCNPEEHKELNLLDLRIDELAISYSLKYTDTACVPGIAKVVVFPTSIGPDVEDCTVIAVFEDGKLGFARSGDEKWTLIDEQSFHYDDVIVYNRQYYAVDRWGTVFWIDSSMRLVQFSPPLIGLGQQKHLVECGGELLVIDRFLDKERSVQHPTDIMDDAHPMAIPFRRPDNDSSPRAVDFKAHKLDQEWGTWVELKNLGNRSIILGNDCCLSFEASEFEGCKENCIYYTDVNDNEFSKRSFSRVFDLEGGRIGNILCYPGRIGIFSPPPIWLSKSLPPLKDILFAASPHRHEN
ncbi:putative F-box protein At1g65770 [Cucurbita pepo subsp. pepo]|uniref:putative F-box protein At1g65770 n=1 Tax=Cucurbita pepo subsp. pepo TaxID=3664 RepID=UPI000C9D626C|nr:putative F-box protein At1g65770 [Cucurbita pepo subsp. pepo]